MSDIRDFLTSRRARLTPERAGLPRYGTRRRVAGLRREEVALLAGISVEYYIRLERGNGAGVSEDVLEAVSQALQLDEAERDHLFDLVRSQRGVTGRRRESDRPGVRPSIRRLLDALVRVPAFVQNGRLDILYANVLAKALYSEHHRDPVRPVNPARYLFLDAAARDFYVDWATVAHDIVADLHREAGRHPHDQALAELVGQLSTRSIEFRRLWAGHDVRYHRSGVKRFRHPLVGDLTLSFESLDLPADPGLRLITYSAEPGTSSDTALGRLEDWTATRERLTAAMAQTEA